MEPTEGPPGYQSAQIDLDLRFVIVPDSSKLQQYSTKKISKSVNHPNYESQLVQSLVQLLFLLKTF